MELGKISTVQYIHNILESSEFDPTASLIAVRDHNKKYLNNPSLGAYQLSHITEIQYSYLLLFFLYRIVYDQRHVLPCLL